MKALSLLVLSFALAATSARAEAPADVQNKVHHLLKDAGGFYSAGRYDLTIKRCNQVLEIDPGNVSALAQREMAKRQKVADEPKKAEEEQSPRAFYPTFPPQEIGPLPGPGFYK